MDTGLSRILRLGGVVLFFVGVEMLLFSTPLWWLVILIGLASLLTGLFLLPRQR